MAGKIVTLEGHRLGEPRHGQWCPHCNLPSALKVTFGIANGATLEVFHRFDIVACDECGDVHAERIR